MSLGVGARLGHYAVTAKLGEGGMGEVWRATDTQLNRDVALKILPEAFATDPDRLARFQREAQVLASLNHPNIAQIHGIEDSDDTRALVLELVEGPTLADRISKGPIPIDEALPIAKQIAEALEAAHEAGVIHRDLKPANIKVREDGTVKVLDFGLAKALDPNPTGDPSQSPTLTAAATQMGVIMGTAAYMSPEQARGKPVDRRADIWSFGVVLYEMLLGRRLFEGQTVSDTLAAVLTHKPEWSNLPPGIPSSVHRALRRCLQKDRRERTQHIGDTRIEITDAVSAPTSGLETPAPVSGRRYGVAALALTGVLAALLSGSAVWSLMTPSAPSAQRVVRFVVSAPDQHRVVALEEDRDEVASLPYPPLAVAPDGGTLAYVASSVDGPPQLYLRELVDQQARRLPDTENADLPFFSPDGRWVGFWANGALLKVSVDGGAPEKIIDLPRRPRGAVWAPEDTIILGGSNVGLQRVSADGGALVSMTQPDFDRGEQYHAWPEVLPEGNYVLFTAVTGQGSDLAMLSLETDEWRILEGTSGAAQPHYLDSGHLVFFARAGCLPRHSISRRQARWIRPSRCSTTC